MSAGGPLKRSDFSAKEIHIFTQVSEKLKSGAWTKEKAVLFFKNDPHMVKRFNAFDEMCKDEAIDRIAERTNQIVLILSQSAANRQNTIDESRAKAANTIVKELSKPSSTSSFKPS